MDKSAVKNLRTSELSVPKVDVSNPFETDETRSVTVE